ncbi:hypothetical protein [Cysteiniphilum litorale]|uniref:hypothetical protein n=1 Tax=Cysteiniphilum litorale TaxID=2056700 RepID=UPI003F880705
MSKALGLLLLMGLLSGCPADNKPTVAISYPTVVTSSCNFVVSVSLENTGLPLVNQSYTLSIQDQNVSNPMTCTPSTITLPTSQIQPFNFICQVPTVAGEHNMLLTVAELDFTQQLNISANVETTKTIAFTQRDNSEGANRLLLPLSTDYGISNTEVMLDTGSALTILPKQYLSTYFTITNDPGQICFVGDHCITGVWAYGPVSLSCLASENTQVLAIDGEYLFPDSQIIGLIGADFNDKSVLFNLPSVFNQHFSLINSTGNPVEKSLILGDYSNTENIYWIDLTTESSTKKVSRVTATLENQTFPLDILFDTGGAAPVIYSKLIFTNTSDSTIDITNLQAQIFTLNLGHHIDHIHDPKKDTSVLNSGSAFFKSNDIIFDYPNNRIGIRSSL